MHGWTIINFILTYLLECNNSVHHFVITFPVAFYEIIQPNIIFGNMFGASSAGDELALDLWRNGDYMLYIIHDLVPSSSFVSNK